MVVLGLAIKQNNCSLDIKNGFSKAHGETTRDMGQENYINFLPRGFDVNDNASRENMKTYTYEGHWKHDVKDGDFTVVWPNKTCGKVV